MVNASDYTPPGKKDRACKHWWFDAWDWLVNIALRAAGPPKVVIQAGELAIDPHIHTVFSRCSISPPDRVMLRAASLGLGGVGILDHNDTRGIREIELCADDLKVRGMIPEDFIVITGVEINTSRGHIGALFVRESFPGELSPDITVRMIHEAGGLAVALHPYHSTGIGDVLFDVPIDAVETHCGSVFNREQNEKNLALISDSRLASVAKLGSSDAHYLRGIASCYSVFNIENRTPKAIKSAILNGQVRSEQSDHYLRVQRLLGRLSKLN